MKIKLSVKRVPRHVRGTLKPVVKSVRPSYDPSRIFNCTEEINKLYARLKKTKTSESSESNQNDSGGITEQEIIFKLFMRKRNLIIKFVAEFIKKYDSR